MWPGNKAMVHELLKEGSSDSALQTAVDHPASRNRDAPASNRIIPVIQGFSMSGSSSATATHSTAFANPAPLGLLGFGMTTVLLNIHNAGFYPLTSMILAMGIFYGGLAQLIAGLQEWKMGNTFGATAFTSYGCFWLTLVGLMDLPKLGFAADSGTSMAAYLAMWGVFTLCMFFGTLKINRCLQVIFGSLVVLFFLLAMEKATDSELLGHIAGFEGIFCGLSAIYGAIAQILNEVYGRTVLPLGAPQSK